MRLNEGKFQAGVAEAFGFWLQEHSVTTPDCVESGIKDAFKDWLFDHTEELLDRIADRIAKRLRLDEQ